jgi:hydrogenase maturation protein HypF
VLACGGWFKNTVCLTRGNEAFVSQHLGDLDNAPTCEALEETVAHLMEVLEIQPEIVAHDLHPDFYSSRFGIAFAVQHGIPALGVQHHHAHIASVLAEHGVNEPALGLALDGIGLGSDGAAWGGELLRVAGCGFERLGHLAHLQLPGGDRAAREPWRMAASALHRMGRDDEISRRFAMPAADVLRQMLEQGVKAPATSSCGRLFDAAAGLLRIRDVTSFEGQAAMLLEGLAERHGEVEPLANAYVLAADGTLDFLPLLAVLADMPDPAFGAALFHATLAQGLAAWVTQAAAHGGVKIIALGGGCFLNAILSRNLHDALTGAGLTVLAAHQVPPNDGGLSLGQAWVAINRGCE